VSAPDVILGVTRPQPLRELSALLGVTVTDVQQCRVIVNGKPQPDLNAWRLELPGCTHGMEDPDFLRDGRPWSRVVKSREFRSQWWLNRWAGVWGRDPGLPELTKDKGRQALRLLHEAVEVKAANTTTEGMTDR
jgi:hypothetical protein